MSRTMIPRNADALDLEHELADLPSDELLAQTRLLIELPPRLFPAGLSRLRLALEELQRRAERGELAGVA